MVVSYWRSAGAGGRLPERIQAMAAKTHRTYFTVEPAQVVLKQLHWPADEKAAGVWPGEGSWPGEFKMGKTKKPLRCASGN